MNRTQRIQLTPHKSPVADVSGTVRVPIRRFWLLWRMAGAVFAMIVSGYALVMQGIHYGDQAPQDMAAIAQQQIDRQNPTDAKELVTHATHDADRMQNYMFHRWPIWSFGITAYVLLLASRTLFLEFGRLQGDEPGVIASPRTLTVNVDAKRRKLKPIPWTAVSGTELQRVEGFPGLTIRLREPGHVVFDGVLASRLPNTGRTSVALSSHYLGISAKELKELLDGYIATSASSTALSSASVARSPLGIK